MNIKQKEINEFEAIWKNHKEIVKVFDIPISPVVH